MLYYRQRNKRGATMTYYLYQLSTPNSDAVYIGVSKNVSERFKQQI